jgi:translation initiation factor IF-1
MSGAGQHRAHELQRRDFTPDAAEGVVVDVARGDLHHLDVTIGAVVRRVIARRSGKLDLRRIRLIAGDRCLVVLDPYDPSRGRIVRRIDPQRRQP